MTKDELISAISWVEAETEKAEESAKQLTDPPTDWEGRCVEHAKHLRETAQIYRILAEAAKSQLDRM